MTRAEALDRGLLALAEVREGLRSITEMELGELLEFQAGLRELLDTWDDELDTTGRS